MTNRTVQDKIREKKNKMIEILEKTPIVQAACSRIGIGRATYYRWCKRDEKFACKAEEALLKGKYLISDLAESKLISLIKDDNLGACIFWLRNHHKDYKARLEINADIRRTDKLTLEQKVIVQKALERVNPLNIKYGQSKQKDN